MGLKMGSLWCEVLINSKLTKRLFWTIALFCLEITSNGTPSVMFFQSPCAKAGTLSSWQQMAKVSTDQVNNPKSPKDKQSALLMPVEQLPASTPDSLPNLIHQTFLQAQNPSVPSEILQPNPNEDRFPQPAPTPEPIPDLEPTEPVQSPPPPPESTDTDSQTVQVQKIEVIGSSIFTPEQFKCYSSTL